MDEPEYVSLAEVKELLEAEQEKRELTYEQTLGLQHAQLFAGTTGKKAKKIIKELAKFEFISPMNAVKIADMLPEHPDDVRALFAKERFTLEQGDVDEIIKIVQDNR